MKWHERLAHLAQGASRAPHEIAEGMGVDVCVVEAWLRGDSSPSVELLVPIAKAVQGDRPLRNTVNFLAFGGAEWLGEVA